MDKENSERINLIRFPLIVGIVFLHAYSDVLVVSSIAIGPQNSGNFSILVRDYFSQVLARVCVPLYFILAGYLFFYGFNSIRDQYRIKVKSRIHTLLIPYLFWNVLILLFYLITQTIPYTSRYFSGLNRTIISYSLFDIIDAILGITRPPIATQFWFIRDLIVMVALVPFLYFIIKRIPYIFLPIILLMWMFEIWPLSIPNPATICFFSIGAYLGLKKFSFQDIDAYGKKILIIYFIISIIDVATKPAKFNIYLHNIGILFGIISAIYLTREIQNNQPIRKIFTILAPTTFLIFALHEPLQVSLRKIMYVYLSPDNDITIIALYFIIPIVVILICIITYNILKRYIPNPLQIITGGR